MLTAYTTALAVILGSLAVGSGLCRAAAVRPRAWLAPAIGLGALLALTRVTVRLPGAGATSLAIVLALVLVCAALSWWPDRDQLWPPLRQGAPTAVLALAAASLPFIASNRYGLLGPTVNGDPAFHLVWIDHLQEGIRPLGIAPGYPVAPHSLVATVSEATQDPADSFTGLLLAVPVLTALTARGFLADLTPTLRTAAAALTALPYLAASYFAEASYKEPIEALIVLGLAAAARELSLGLTRRTITVLLLAIFVLASMGTHGTGGAIWPLAALVAWAAAELIARRRLPRLPRIEWRALGAEAAIAVAIAVVLILRTPHSVLGDILSSSGEGGPGAGNLIAALSPLEGLGVWLSSDFRIDGPNPGATTALDVLAVALALFGLWWWVRRRELALPAVAVAVWLVYLFLTQTASAYYSAKGLAVLAPITMLIILRPLLVQLRWPPTPDAFSIARLAIAATFATAAIGSTLLALRGATVDDQVHLADLARFAPRTAGQPTLFLATDAYARYELRDSNLAVAFVYGPLPPTLAPLRPAPGWSPGAAFDFSSVEAPGSPGLDQFRYVITTRTAYAGLPPPNWRPVTSGRYYTLWQRTGPTPTRHFPPLHVLPGTSFPGTTLNCGQPAALRISRQKGTALVRPAPVVSTQQYWRHSAGPGVPSDIPGMLLGYGQKQLRIVPGTFTANETVAQPLRLTPGRYDLSIQYDGAMGVTVRAPGLNAALPANTDLVGPWWSAGTLTIARPGPVTVTVTARSNSAIDVPRVDQVFGVAATPLEPRPTRVPLNQACGRYVDSYTTQ